MHFFRFICIFLFFAPPLLAQNTALLVGTVRDKASQEVLIGATVKIENTGLGATTDTEGNFRIAGVPPKSYTLTASYLGYETSTRYNIVLTTGNVAIQNFELEAESSKLGEVVISQNRSVKIASAETPLSTQNLSVEEIKSNPGGNFDISRVVQALPGVGGSDGSSGGFRNDLIVRGGAPNENVYYLDGVEIPVINHFSTQGAAGGPAGILNVSFIEDATLATSAFPARYDNPLSSVLQFRQRDGNSERFQGNIRLSGTETALTGDGPIGSKTTYLVSARRSYLQFLFGVLGLPIRPNYWDFQYKITHKFNARTTLTSIGVGAIDEFTFAAPKDASPENLYILSSVPGVNQWNYTQGFTLKQLIENGFWNLTFSRNMFDNRLDQFADNYDSKQTDENKRILGLNSQEIENKLRFDFNRYNGPWKWSFGAGLQFVKYNNQTFALLRPEVRDSAGNVLQARSTANFSTAIDFVKFGAFGQLNRTFFNERLSLSFGLRSDGNSFADQGANLLKTLSPRLSGSYGLLPKWKLNASLGRYYKIAPYTALGFRDENNVLVNRDLPYTRCDHFVAGLEYLPNPGLRITVEGFYKKYSDYLVSASNGLSLANAGGAFTAVGNERLLANGQGRSYGTELFVQQKLTKRLFFITSYTLFWTKFSGADGRLIPSAWDNRHLLSLTAGYKFRRNWEIGAKFRSQGGVPYTPLDLEASRQTYATLGSGTLDYMRINQERLQNFSQLDLRVDKKWNFRRSTFDLFLDVTNLLGRAAPQAPTYTFQRNADNTAFATTDGQSLRSDGSNAIPIILGESAGSALPTIGFIFEF